MLSAYKRGLEKYTVKIFFRDNGKRNNSEKVTETEDKMIQIPVKQASNELDKLLSQVAQGQELVIISSDGSAFKLLALPRIPQPIFGSAKGLINIGPDFDEPIEGFEEYMP